MSDGQETSLEDKLIAIADDENEYTQYRLEALRLLLVKHLVENSGVCPTIAAVNSFIPRSG